jgi:hypothetical protein
MSQSISTTPNTAFNSFLGTSNILAGIASLTIDGEIFDVITATYSPAQLQFEGLIALNGPNGLKATPRYGYIAAQVRDAGNLSVAQICAKTNSSVVLVTAAGKTVSGTGMFFSGDPSEVEVAEGTFSLHFSGTNVNEVLATNSN